MAVAIAVAAVALPVCAQRGSAHGGSSGRGAPAVHAGRGASIPNRGANLPRPAGGRPGGMFNGNRRTGAGMAAARPPYTGARRPRRPYISPYGYGVGWGAPGWGSPYLSAYPDAVGDDDSQAAQDYAPDGGEGQPAAQEQPEPRVPYQPSSDPQRPSQTAASEDEVTVIFKDGRPSEQIRNYVLTSTTLYIYGQRHREIPIDQLDLVATAKVNHEEGTDFHLPGATR